MHQGFDVNRRTFGKESPLGHAINHGTYKMVRLLVEHGADVVGESYPLPFFEAIDKGDLDIVKYLVEHGADVNQINKYCHPPRTPVVSAIDKGDLNVLKYLIENGADWKSALKEHHPPRDPAVLRYLLSLGLDANLKGREGKTSLHYVEYIELMDILLAAGADPNIKDDKGWTPLDCAIKNDNYQKIKWLIAHGADRNGRHFLNLAAVNGDLEMVKRLVEGGEDVNRIDYFRDCTALYDLFSAKDEISQTAREEIARYLLEHGADVTIGRKRYNGYYGRREHSSLEMIAAYGSLALLQDAMNAVDIRKIRDLYARDLIIGAVSGGNMENLSFILAEIGDGINVRHILNAAMEDAVPKGDLELVKFLLKHGASVNATYFENASEMSERETLLQIAAETGNKAMLSFLLDNGAIMESTRGASPLLAALEQRHLEAAKLLLERGAAVNVRGCHGESPLMVAVMVDDYDMVKFLLDHGADVHAVADDGLGPVHHAAKTGNVEIMKLLLAAGAEYDSDNNRKKEKPIIMAVREGNLAMIKMLLGRYDGEDRQEIIKLVLDAIAQRRYWNLFQSILDFVCSNEQAKLPKEKPASLHEAVKQSDVEAVKELVDAGTEINAFDDDGNTPLDLAFIQPIGILGSDGEIMEAFADSKPKIVRLLIEHDAKLNKVKPTLFVEQYHLRLDETMMKYLLKNGADVNEQNRSYPWSNAPTPIYRFLGSPENFPLLELLLAAGADVNFHENKAQTPLRYLMENDRPIYFAVLKSLLAHGADVNIDMPIAKAVQTNKYDVASVILDNCKSLAANREHAEAICKAIADGKQEIAEKMKKIMPKTNLSKEAAEELLRELAFNGDVMGMHRLMTAEEADVNSKNRRNDTPLFYAMEGGKLDAAMYLINHGADIKALGNGDETLLHCAAMQDLSLVKYLVEHGLDVNAKNNAGVTPLHHAICRNRLDVAAYLLEHGADIQMAAANETPLAVCASLFGTVETMKFLAEKGVDFKAKTKDGFTAMHVAAAVNPALVPYLKSLGLPELSKEEVRRAKKAYIDVLEPENIDCDHVWRHENVKLIM
ncbi:MAG: ankyrin repeat domain-containing protein [Victivallales bacterium]|nr:ankyrin repeat domain-containing protein [Victivallales bacterium]